MAAPPTTSWDLLGLVKTSWDKLCLNMAKVESKNRYAINNSSHRPYAFPLVRYWDSSTVRMERFYIIFFNILVFTWIRVRRFMNIYANGLLI